MAVLPGLLHLPACFVFPHQERLHLGKVEFAGKRGAIISVLCEWETELGERQISW